MPNRNIYLTDEAEAEAERLVEEGEYGNISEAIRGADLSEEALESRRETA